MKLLDVAQVVYGDGQWTLGGDTDNRECAAEVRLTDACTVDPAGTAVVTGDVRTTYRVRSFGLFGEMPQPIGCVRPDDEKWLSEAVDQATDQALGKALYVEPYAGSETWLGASGVTVITAGADLAVDALTARKTWYADNLGQAIMHVTPSSVPDLVLKGLLQIVESSQDGIGTVVSALGDPVAVSNGYGTSPKVFFTGPIEVRLSSPDTVIGFNAKNNQAVVQVNRVASIDVAPCSIIIVGAVAA